MKLKLTTVIMAFALIGASATATLATEKKMPSAQQTRTKEMKFTEEKLEKAFAELPGRNKCQVIYTKNLTSH